MIICYTESMENLLRKFRLLVLLLTLTLLIFSSRTVFACTPGGPNPWFATKLSFDQITLPNGIEIVQTDPTYEPYALANNNSDPFYLVRENLTDWKTFPNSELPKNYEPLYKLINGQSFYYIDDTYSKPPNSGYKPNSGGINNSATSRVEIDERIYTLEGESKQISQDNRPTNVEIPEPQNFKILGFFRGALVEIRGTLHYSLNEKYDPQAFAKGVEACNSWDQSMNSPMWRLLSFVPLVIVILILSGVGFLTYKIIKRFRK